MKLEMKKTHSMGMILACGNDCRVRNRNAERMLEQGGDGKPVGEPADHCGLGERLNPAKPWVARAKVVGYGERHCREDEKASRAELHCLQLFRADLLVESRNGQGAII